MIVRICDEGGRLSFGAAGGIAVEVPEGSQVLPTRLLGPVLFVPVDPCQRTAFEAREVLAAARADRPGFRFA